MKINKTPTKLKPKFKFGQTIKFHDEFHGVMEGRIQDVVEVQLGYLFWKKFELIYTVDVETTEFTLTAYVGEKFIQPVVKIKSVK